MESTAWPIASPNPWIWPTPTNTPGTYFKHSKHTKFVFVRSICLIISILFLIYRCFVIWVIMCTCLVWPCFFSLLPKIETAKVFLPRPWSYTFWYDTKIQAKHWMQNQANNFCIVNLFLDLCDAVLGFIRAGTNILSCGLQANLHLYIHPCFIFFLRMVWDLWVP